MATLNVKNLPDGLYRKLKARAKRERRSISQEVVQILSRELQKREPISLMQLEGLGRDAWVGIDPIEHVDRERRAWD